MPCYKPYLAFDTGFQTKNGKRKFFVTHNYVDTVKLNDGTLLKDPIEVPCHSCVGCRLDYANEWTCRLYSEFVSYPNDSCWFLTFTYDDDHLSFVPECTGYSYDYVPNPNNESHNTMIKSFTYEVNEDVKIPNLEYRDIQLFLKRIRIDQKRKYGVDNIKFYVSGEYGPTTLRPHWHMIIFGVYLDPKELKLYKFNHQNSPMYNHPYLDNLWKKGFITVERNDLGTFNYVARYSAKKLSSSNHTPIWKLRHFESRLNRDIDSNPKYFCEIASDNGFCDLDELRSYLSNDYYNSVLEDDFALFGSRMLCRKEFSVCSQGIGRSYFESHIDEIYENDFIYLAHKRFKVPRYFDKLLEERDPERYRSVCADRSLRARKRLDQWHHEHPNLNRREWLNEQEVVFEEKMKKSRITVRKNVEEVTINALQG